MMAVLKVEIDSVSVHYHVIVSLTNRTKEFRVRDDGWKLWIQTTAGVSVGGISFGTDSDRKPDQASALVHLTKWAEAKYGDNS